MIKSIFYIFFILSAKANAQIIPPFIQNGIDKILEPRRLSQNKIDDMKKESDDIPQVTPNKGNVVCGSLSYIRQTQLFDLKIDNNQTIRVLLHPVILDKKFDIYVLIDKITSDYGCAYLYKFAYRMPDGTNIWKGSVFSGYPGVDIGLTALKNGWGFYIPDHHQADNQAQIYERAQAYAKKWKIGVFSNLSEIPPWVYEFHKQ